MSTKPGQGQYISPDLTLKQFMKDWRNKVMSHPRFTPRSVLGVYEAVEGMDDAYFSQALHRLYWQTWHIFQVLKEAYPEAVEIDRKRHAVDKSP